MGSTTIGQLFGTKQENDRQRSSGERHGGDGKFFFGVCDFF